jgi:hypothetical protein
LVCLGASGQVHLPKDGSWARKNSVAHLLRLGGLRHDGSHRHPLPAKSYFGPQRLEAYLISQVKGAAVREKAREALR